MKVMTLGSLSKSEFAKNRKAFGLPWTTTSSSRRTGHIVATLAEKLSQREAFQRPDSELDVNGFPHLI